MLNHQGSLNENEREVFPRLTKFVSDDVLGGLGTLSRERADALDIGIIQVDDAGVIQLYNQAESELSGLPIDRAEGRNFFTAVAPCTNNPLFYGAFKRGIASGTMNQMFPYTFTYKMKPTAVRIHLYRDPGSKTNWIFVRRA